jgi:hypothetical protein
MSRLIVMLCYVAIDIPAKKLHSPKVVYWKPVKNRRWIKGLFGVYLPFRWVLSAMWLCKSGHFHSCCPSPMLNILLEIL